MLCYNHPLAFGSPAVSAIQRGSSRLLRGRRCPQSTQHKEKGSRMGETEALRQSILAQVAEYYQKAHHDKPFEPGQTTVNYAGRVYDEAEMQNMVSAVLDFWLTAGPMPNNSRGVSASSWASAK